MNQGEVRTVFATATLAQGINLPFNVSVVTYTDQFNRETGRTEPIDAGRIMNMLGRAGRAGKVADGLCLLSLESPRRDRVALMRRSGSIYFAAPHPNNVVGLASLLLGGVAVIGTSEWPRHLVGVRSFTDAQMLISLALRIAATGVEDASGVREYLQAYPSVAALGAELRESFAIQLAALIANLRAMLAHDATAFNVTARTGLPPEYCSAIAAAVASGPRDMTGTQWSDWSDAAVTAALAATSAREWQRDVLSPYSADTVIQATTAWRAGAPVATLEDVLVQGEIRRERPRIGEFLNHQMGVLAQFWAAIPVAAEALGRADILEGTRPIPAFIRDGVPNIDALVFLRVLGGLDRVLATSIAAANALPGSTLGRKQQSARRTVAQWRSGRVQTPAEHRSAIRDILREAE